MKIRNGFVSNSSSSSFIVGFDKIPTTIEEMQTILYGNTEMDWAFSNDDTPDEDEPQISTIQLAARVFGDIKGRKPLTEDSIINKLMDGYIREINNKLYNLYNKSQDNDATLFDLELKQKYGDLWYDVIQSDPLICKKRKELWNVENKRRDEKHLHLAKEFWNTRKNKFKGLNVFDFTYADDNGIFECVLEHGMTFKRLPHIYISNH